MKKKKENEKSPRHSGIAHAFPSITICPPRKQEKQKQKQKHKKTTTPIKLWGDSQEFKMLSCVLTLLLSQTFLSELGLHQSVLRAVALLAITFTRCQLQTEWGSSHVILFVSRDCTLFSNTERPPKAKHVGSKHKPLFLSATPFTPEKQQKLSKKVNKHPYRAFF